MKADKRAWVSGAMLACGLAGGCAQPPVGMVRIAQEALQEARAGEATVYAPDRLKAAEDSLKAATTEMKRQGRRMVFLRRYEQALGLAIVSQRRAQRARAEAVENKAKAKQEAERLVAEAASAVALGRQTVGSMPVGRGTKAALSAAAVALEEARHLMAKTAYAAAEGRAKEVKAQVARVEGEVQAAIQRYMQEQAWWRRWADETIGWSARSGGYALIVDKIGHVCEVYRDGRLQRTYRVDLGIRWMGDKLRGGDGTTPEGKYRIVAKKGPGETRFYKALLLNYPNEEDVQQFHAAKRSGLLPRNASIGGLIEIHGTGGQGKDWTAGCVALTNRDIDELFSFIPVGTPVTIVGYRDRGGDGDISALMRPGPLHVEPVAQVERRPVISKAKPRTGKPVGTLRSGKVRKRRG